MKVEERFINYVKVYSESDPESKATPSTKCQLEFAKMLADEMKALGISNVDVDTCGIVYGEIPANCDGVCTIGFIAHMDTSPDLSGKDVKPRIVHDYDGSPIVLNKEKNIVLDPAEFSSLIDNVHEDLIVTDGTTLLGGDDKAGIAEIMTMAEYLLQNPEVKHGTIKIAFTPDEEVGRGTDNFDIEKFNAEFAYTVDGGAINDINYENFNAAAALVKVHGMSIHPGSAKGKMLNSQLVAMEFHSLLPVFENPACTEGYEGFNHLTTMQGGCEETTMNYIIRNHDETLFAKQKQDFMNAAEFLNKKYPSGTIELDITDTYANMRNWIEKDMRVIDLAKKSIEDLGMTPVSTAIRGGTDGARLTWNGLLCPNIGTGGYNCHGKFEYVSIQRMEQSVKLILKIIENSLNL